MNALGCFVARFAPLVGVEARRGVLIRYEARTATVVP